MNRDLNTHTPCDDPGGICPTTGAARPPGKEKCWLCLDERTVALNEEERLDISPSVFLRLDSTNGKKERDTVTGE